MGALDIVEGDRGSWQVLDEPWAEVDEEPCVHRTRARRHEDLGRRALQGEWQKGGLEWDPDSRDTVLDGRRPARRWRPRGNGRGPRPI